MCIWGLTQEAAAGSDCPFAGDVSYVRCSFQGRLHPFRSPVDESKKSTVRFFTVLILLKATMRFEEGPRSSSLLAFQPTRQLTSQLPRLGFQQRP